MKRYTRKNFPTSKKNKKTRMRRKQRGGACNTSCPENCWTEEQTNAQGKKVKVRVCGAHDFSATCKNYRGMQNCKACSQCGEWCIYS
jgi:hypothetical protein